jgi:short-subunit dehydrogenase
MLENMLNRDEAYIINISSMGGFFPFPKQSIYGASKAATKLFTEGLYAELLDTKVKVMVVFPGAISTDILKNSNVSVTTTKENSSYKMTSPEDTASQIIKGINKNKFKLYIGSDSKFMNFLYKMNSKSAINYINKKMKDLN